MKKRKKIIKGLVCGAAVTYAGMKAVSKIRQDHEYDEENEEILFKEGKEETSLATGSRYARFAKRAMDVTLSLAGLVFLAPVYAGISLAIVIDDPGPVLFTQKRVGLNKTHFKLHKFRSMKMCTPHDTPTHLLENPEQYITRVGKFLRKYSLDELPQIWDIFIGNMSIIGPRPALWNQFDLIEEREKYGANDVRPGLTGWAQINGRDELEIDVKARLDGDYVKALHKGSFAGFRMDLKCFFGTIFSVAKADGVVEGGTGELHNKANKNNREHSTGDKKSDREEKRTNEQIGFGRPVVVDYTQRKKVLITGANSYIGVSFENYAKEHYHENFQIDTLDMIGESWREYDFSGYDTVYHVAGIAHADVGNVSEETKKKYYSVNRDLAIETARKAKEQGVSQFVFMSSMIIYGDSAPFGKEKYITKDTLPAPDNFYGDSKWQADQGVRALADDAFHVLVLRPPMIYGKGSKGNYPTLAKLARKMPVFPNVENSRSMLYIENLCEFLCQVMLVGEGGIFFPQNGEYTKTADMVKEISMVSGKHIRVTKLFNPAVRICSKLPGKIGGLANKAFGNLTYDQTLSDYEGIDYRVVDLADSVRRTESTSNSDPDVFLKSGEGSDKKKPKALMLASVASMIDQFNMHNIALLQELGYDVDVVCNCKVGNTISDDRIAQLSDRLAQLDVKMIHSPIPRKVSDIKGILRSIRQVKHLCRDNHYQIVHCHSPIGSVIARLAVRSFRKTGTKVIYTAHGFHFYKGAPLKNWIVFWPIEKICSHFTDILITINHEDFAFAQKHMNAKTVKYVPGIGVETERFRLSDFDREGKRKELDLTDDDFMILSVGELNKNKNQEVIIRALAKVQNPHIHYVIAGKGDRDEYLMKLAGELGVHLQLLGYRTDIVELLNCADAFALPSKREGLSASLMEAMAAELPCLVSEIRGNVDLIENGSGGYVCKYDNSGQFAEAIRSLLRANLSEMGKYNSAKIKKFDVSIVNSLMKDIYQIADN